MKKKQPTGTYIMGFDPYDDSATMHPGRIYITHNPKPNKRSFLKRLLGLFKAQ